jgi:PAS domain S-box-containing protein
VFRMKLSEGYPPRIAIHRPAGYTALLFFALIFPVLYIVSRYNYNLFHGLADIFTIVIAGTVFVVAWNSRESIDNDYLLYAGIGFLSFAFLDLFHVLGNKDTGVFPQYGNLGPTLYIASRYVLSISLVTAPLFINRKLRVAPVFAAYSLITLLVLLSVFYWENFPVCFVEGVGLTTFKVMSDYLICMILLGALVLLLLNRRSFDARVLRLLAASILFSIATGLAFTLYADPFGLMNAIGHFFQILSFYLVYLAVIETGLTKPQDVLFRKLKQSEEKYRLLVEHAPTAIFEIDFTENRFKTVNEAACRMLGFTEAEILAMNPVNLLDPDSREIFLDRLRRAQKGEALSEEIEYKGKRKDRSEIWGSLHCRFEYRDGSVVGAFVVAHDITERKRAEESLVKSEGRFKLLSHTSGRLLVAADPQQIVNELCREVMRHLDCQAFFNFLVDEVAGKLHLNACAGIPEEEVRKIEWLNFGVAVCGCVARGGFPIVAEDIFHVPDVRTELVKSYGIQAYACHPLKVEGRLIGTLSFGTKTRPSFSPEDLALMRTVTDQVATAMERIRLIKVLRKSRDELEKRVQERTAELAKSQERLQHLASQLLLAQEKERKRVAVDLHDGLLSELAAMKILFEAKVKLLEQGKLSDLGELRKVSDILALVMRDARRIMNNLHPSVLDELGLIAAISWLTGEYEKSYPHIKVQKRLEVSEQDIKENVRVVIFRVLQEALNNFAKHGKGDRVELSLAREEGTFAFTIQDNGQGFDVENTQRGLGLDSMQERVELSGGKFQIESIIGQGTSIRSIWRI